MELRNVYSGTPPDHFYHHQELRMFLTPPQEFELVHSTAAGSGASHQHQPQLLNMFPQSSSSSELLLVPAMDSEDSQSAAVAALDHHHPGSHQQQYNPHLPMELELQHEHLFYKVVTPSDVGKLNRLVIPKQHAERCFPLEASQRKKGRFLSFQESVTGKVWWFRYSYWNSSQSYVFTKGWIRFVKENNLKAGDIVSFERGPGSEFYISCRRRPSSSPGSSGAAPHPSDCSSSQDALLLQMFSHHHYNLHEQHQHQQLENAESQCLQMLDHFSQPEDLEEEDEDDDQSTTSSAAAVAAAAGASTSKLYQSSTRLFGVDIGSSAAG